MGMLELLFRGRLEKMNGVTDGRFRYGPHEYWAENGSVRWTLVNPGPKHVESLNDQGCEPVLTRFMNRVYAIRAMAAKTHEKEDCYDPANRRELAAFAQCLENVVLAAYMQGSIFNEQANRAKLAALPKTIAVR